MLESQSQRGLAFAPPLQEGRIHPYPLECVFEHNPDTERLNAGICLTDLTVDKNTYMYDDDYSLDTGNTLTYLHYSQTVEQLEHQ